MRTRLRPALGALLLVAVLGACDRTPTASSAGAAAGDSSATVTAAWPDVAPAAEAGTVGSPGSRCPLPVSFGLARAWRPQQVPAGLGVQGGFTLRCEVDAKPAGALGFLRVWSGGRAGEDAAQALQAFLAADRNLLQLQQRTVRAGNLTAAEARYLRNSALTGTSKPERVLAVRTSTGVVVLVLGGLDTQEHEKMLPAYELAKRSMALTG